MKEYKCIVSFTSAAGKLYYAGTVIGDREYLNLSFFERKWFSMVRPIAPITEDTPITPYPEYLNIDDNNFHDDSIARRTDEDTPSFGGGSFGGAGAGSSYESNNDNNRNDNHDDNSDNSSDNSSDSSSDSSSSSDD